jgi:hypothetical protein
MLLRIDWAVGKIVWEYCEKQMDGLVEQTRGRHRDRDR